MLGNKLVFAVLMTALSTMPVLARADYLTTESFSISSTGGVQGAGSPTSDMIYNGTGPDGISWAGGAEGVQGASAVHGTSGKVTAANVALKFDVGTVVSNLNATYGAGNWTISNAVLTFSTSYSTVGNSRFGNGSGTFDIDWMGNSNWAQTESTTNNTNPVYASTLAGLTSWAGSAATLASAYYNYNSSASTLLHYSLGSNALFTNSILNATSNGSTTDNTSLYLMATSSTLGMLLYTGGGSNLPTLSFEVDSATPTPIPAAMYLLGSGLLGLFGLKRKRHFSV